MENNKYREAMGRITTPSELKEKTRRMLAAESARSKNIWKPASYMALAASFLLVAGVGFWVFAGGPGSGLLGGDIPGKSEHGSGEPVINAPESQAPEANTPGSVLVGDAVLNFVFVDDDQPPIRMAHQYPLRKGISPDELPGVIPGDAPDGFMLIDETITAFFSAPSDTPDAVFGEITYQTQSGALLTVLFADMPIYLPIEISGSLINDTQVGLGYTEADEKLYAAFEKRGLTYLLTAEGINRHEFTQALIHFITGI